MADIRLSLIGERYSCVEALFDGVVRARGLELAVTRSPSPEAMRRQLTSWTFDVCEMAFGAYLIARAQGADVTAIPVFPRRSFFHTGFACQPASKVHDPRDLAGKRLGVAEYVQSATVWARGVLEHDFGLDPRTIKWYVERAGTGSTGAVLGFAPPRDLSVHQTPGGKTLKAMLRAAELDAALIGSSAHAADGEGIPLFAEPATEGSRFYRAHGYVPANHLYMVRGSFAREQPQLLESLRRAFDEARIHAQRSLPRGTSPACLFGDEVTATACATIPDAAFGYGIGPNRGMIETVVSFCQEQGLVGQRPPIEELFAAGIG